MVPSINSAQFGELIDKVYPDNQPASTDFARFSKAFLFRNIILMMLPLHIMAAATIIANGQSLYSEQSLYHFLLISSLIFIRCYRWLYAVNDKFACIRKGVLGRLL